jgi:outer membrane protein assembly factor BamA
LNKLKLTLLFVFAVFSSLLAQDSTKPFVIRVDSIAISGNDITDADIVFGELTFDKNDLVDSLILAFNKKRVYSLQLFTTVDFLFSKVDTLNLLTILVKESWYIWPIPFIDRSDKDWTKLSFGLDLKIFNFRGRNEQLSGKVKVGYDPGYSVFYNIPYFLRKQNISLQTDISFTTRKNKSDIAEKLYNEPFKQDVVRALVVVGKRFSLFHRILLFGGFSYIETPTFVKGINASTSNIDRYGFIGAKYTYDTRNLNVAPTSGIFLNTEYTHKGIGNSDVDYGVYTFDIRNYFHLSGIFYAKWRVGLREAFGKNVPYYDYSILSVDDRVRGHYTEKLEGMGIIVSSIETYFNVIEDLPIEFTLPIVPKSLTSYRVNIGFQFFIDAGVYRPIESGYHINQMQRGYGFGITVAVLPYNIARAEIAFNESGASQLILDLGISF